MGDAKLAIGGESRKTTLWATIDYRKNESDYTKQTNGTIIIVAKL